MSGQQIIGTTAILIAIYLILERSQATDSIIRGLAESYGSVVKSLQARS